MKYIELNIVNGPPVCLPIGSFSFSTAPASGGTIIVPLNRNSADSFLHVDESYEYIISSMNTHANVCIIRAPECED